MTADEARKLNDKYALTLNLDEVSIDKNIESAASKGRSSVSLDLMKIEYSYRGRVFDQLKKIFESKGFEVKRSTYSGDMRGESDSRDDAVISW